MQVASLIEGLPSKKKSGMYCRSGPPLAVLQRAHAQFGFPSHDATPHASLDPALPFHIIPQAQQDGTSPIFCTASFPRAASRDQAVDRWKSTHGLPSSDISFISVEGDFQSFRGLWRLQPTARVLPPGYPGRTILSYSLYVQPKAWLPVGLLTNRIEKEVLRNLEAVQQHAEFLHSLSSSSRRGYKWGSLLTAKDEVLSNLEAVQQHAESL
eukprot:gene19745-26437_t